MRWRSSILTTLWPFLAGMLLASCGDFQDPASDAQGKPLSYPSVSQADQQQIVGSESQLASGPPAYAVNTASLPAPTNTAPASTETFGAGSGGDTRANESAAGRFSPPPQSGTAQLSTGGGENVPPWLSSAGPQPEPGGSENGPRAKSVTLTWDPPASGNMAGYRVYVTTVSALAQYTFDAGLQTTITVALPIGERYSVTLTAYNAGGESPPAGPIQFDLF
jgi:hypothetical protein